MRLLVDSHAIIWFAENSTSLSPTAHRHLADPNNELLISAASVWEIAIKVSMGKLTLRVPFTEFLRAVFADYGCELLPIAPPHVDVVANLPFHHKDPFDRMLAAQALTDRLTVVSNDQILDRYGVTRIW